MAEASHHGPTHASMLHACSIIAIGLMIGLAVPPARSSTGVLERTDRPETPVQTSAFSIDDASTTEGDAGVRTLVFVVRLTAPLLQTASVDVMTVDSTATTADQDYGEFHFRILFPAGSTAESLSVTVNGDTRLERDEFLQLLLRDPVGAPIADSMAVGTIVNDDFTTISIQDASTIEGDAGSHTLMFHVLLSEPALDSVTVRASTVDGTATTSDGDYIGVLQEIVLAPGSVADSLAVTVLADTRYEPDEQFRVLLNSTAGAALADSEAVGVIMTDDPARISIDDASVLEGDAGSGDMVFRLHLSAALPQAVTVEVVTFDSTATVADLDYEALAQTVTFPAGSMAESLIVHVTGDTLIERSELLVVRLTSPAGAALADSEAVGRILNDDLPRLEISDASTLEGDSGSHPLTFALHLSNAPLDSVSVQLSTADSTATVPGPDYLPGSGTVVFPPGVQDTTFDVVILSDHRYELDEVFRLKIVQLSGATSARPEALGTIRNDDLPELSITDARVKEGDSGSRLLHFVVRLSAVMPDSISVEAATLDGTAAAADSDYVGLQRRLVFPPGATAETLSVAVLGDTRLESNDWFRVRLSSAGGAVLANDEASGTITNDERTTFTKQWLGSTDYLEGTLPNAWADYDGDGYQDLPLQRGGPNHTFTEIPGFRALLAGGNYHGASWCDYDRDGDPDLILLGYDSSQPDAGGEISKVALAATPNLLLRNDGGGVFTNVAPALGMAIAASGETAVWGDFDGDGWPDLFTPYYSHQFPFQSFFYRSNGDGTFHEQAVESGVSLPALSWSLRPEGALAADWNDDGHLDLYCASHLFVNDGTGHFSDVRDSVGLPVLFDEGSSMVDYDNDGDFDLYLRGGSGPRLFRNDAGHFSDVTTLAGVGEPSLFWGDSWADIDNDGDLDLVQHRQGPAKLMLNQGDGTFERDPAFETVNVGRELSAWADIDGDGDLDVVMGAMGKELLVNRLQSMRGFFASHLRVRVLDAEGHLTAQGATVRLHEIGGPRGTTQTRIVDGGSGYLGQNEYTVHFGVTSRGRYALEVVYPSPAGSRIVVDSTVSRLLAPISPDGDGNLTFTIHRDGRVERSGPSTAGIGDLVGKPGAHAAFGSPSPLPARGPVTLPVQMTREGRVVFSIHDLSGRMVRQLDPGRLPAGVHSVVWNLADERGTTVNAGMYFCRFSVDGRSAGTRRLIVVH